ncbi:MAG: hypothetical protein CMP20_15835 [Rickettsiales bacterium]|nr:hypothetical protein [Rickettsiales bacterium]
MNVGAEVTGGVLDTCPERPIPFDDDVEQFFEDGVGRKHYIYDVQAGLAAVDAGAIVYSIPSNSGLMRVLVGYGNNKMYNAGRNSLFDRYYNPGGRRKVTKELESEQQLIYDRNAAKKAFEFRFRYDDNVPRVLKRINLPRFKLPSSIALNIQTVYAVDFPLATPLWLGNDDERDTAFRFVDPAVLLRQFVYLLLTGTSKEMAIGFGQNYFIDLCPTEQARHTFYINLYDVDPSYGPELATFLFKQYTLELAAVWREKEIEIDYEEEEALSTVLLTFAQAFDRTPANFEKNRKAKNTWSSAYMLELIKELEGRLLTYNIRQGLNGPFS